MCESTYCHQIATVKIGIKYQLISAAYLSTFLSCLHMVGTIWYLGQATGRLTTMHLFFFPPRKCVNEGQRTTADLMAVVQSQRQQRNQPRPEESQAASSGASTNPYAKPAPSTYAKHANTTNTSAKQPNPYAKQANPTSKATPAPSTYAKHANTTTNTSAKQPNPYAKQSNPCAKQANPYASSSSSKTTARPSNNAATSHASSTAHSAATIQISDGTPPAIRVVATVRVVSQRGALGLYIYSEGH